MNGMSGKNNLNGLNGLKGKSNLNGTRDVNNKGNGTGSNDRRCHRAYKDPTADMAIANVMREERRKNRMRMAQQAGQGKCPSSRKPSKGGARHAED